MVYAQEPWFWMKNDVPVSDYDPKLFETVDRLRVKLRPLCFIGPVKECKGWPSFWLRSNFSRDGIYMNGGCCIAPLDTPASLTLKVLNFLDVARMHHACR